MKVVQTLPPSLFLILLEKQKIILIFQLHADYTDYTKTLFLQKSCSFVLLFTLLFLFNLDNLFACVRLNREQQLKGK